MRKIRYPIHFLVWLGLISSLFVAVTPAFALQPTVTILVIPEPNRARLGKNAPLHDYLTTRIYDALIEEGYDAFQPADVDTFQVTAQPTRQDLIETAQRASQPPIDLIVMFRSRIQLRRTSKGSQASLNLFAEVIEVSTKRRLGSLKQRTPNPIQMSENCDRTCMRQTLAPEIDLESATLINRLVTLIEQKAPQPSAPQAIKNENILGLCGMRRGWQIVFEGFEPEVLQVIEAYLVSFSCYISHRPTASRPGEFVFWYESGISPAHFQRNIRRMSADIGFNVSMSSIGNQYTVTYAGKATPSDQSYDGW